jgi:acyl carrier protein
MRTMGGALMIEDQVRRFIVDRFHWDGASGELTDQFPLIDSNLVDSLGLFHIVSFLERQFGVEILDEELVPDHFGTIADIARLIESKKGA